MNCFYTTMHTLPTLLAALLLLQETGAAPLKPIRLLGVFKRSAPIAPHQNWWGPLIPCPSIGECYKGGYPAIAAWMEYYSNPADVRGTVKVMTPDFKSRMIFGHPLGLDLNHETWRRLGVDFATLPDEHMMSNAKDERATELFMVNSPAPFCLAGVVVDDHFAYLSGVLVSWHVKVVDGVTLGLFTLWSSSFGIGQSTKVISHEKLVPIVTRRLRALGVDVVVALRIGQASGEEELTKLTTYDIDVVLQDSDRDINTFAANGTTVLAAPGSHSFGAYPVVAVDLVQDGAAWSYSVHEVNPWKNDTPKSNADPFYQQELLWMQTQLENVAGNDYTLTQSTVAMPATNTVDLRFPCREGECEMGSLTADAMRDEMQTDIAFHNAGMVRGTGWPAGPVRRSHIWTTFPFVNTACRMNVSGATLLAVFNHGTSRVFPNGTLDPSNKWGMFPQVSGMRMVVNPQLEPFKRVTSLDVFLDGMFVPVEKKRLYSFTAPNYISFGGDGYDMLKNNIEAGSLFCPTYTIIQAVESYLKRQTSITPQKYGRITYDFTTTSLTIVNQTKYNCTENQKYDAYWQHCEDCPEGFWHPDMDSPACVEKLPSEVDIGMILGIVFGVLSVCGVPIAWKMTEKQRRINALFNNNKIAEECAIAVMDLRLGDLDYLHELEKPNTIQSAFIAITKQMKVYMEFMPKNLIANCQVSESDTSETEKSCDMSAESSQSHSLKRGLQAKVKMSTTFIKTKQITAFTLNSKGHLKIISDDMLTKHSHFIEQFTTIITAHKGIAETLSGDRMLATWNTVTETVNQAMHSCKAALALQKTLDNTMSIGIAKGSAQFGLFGGEGTKRYDVLGSVIPSASLLMVLNKQYNTSILVSPEVERDGNSFFYFRITDYVCYRKLGTCFVLELAAAKDMGGDEWMYDLEQADRMDPCFELNTAWHYFIEMGTITKGAEVTGILAEVMRKKCKGAYVAECASLDLI